MNMFRRGLKLNVTSTPRRDEKHDSAAYLGYRAMLRVLKGLSRSSKCVLKMLKGLSKSSKCVLKVLKRLSKLNN